MLKLAIGAVVLYCGFVALLYAAQRRLQYFPERRHRISLFPWQWRFATLA